MPWGLLHTSGQCLINAQMQCKPELDASTVSIVIAVAVHMHCALSVCAVCGLCQQDCDRWRLALPRLLAMYWVTYPHPPWWASCRVGSYHTERQHPLAHCGCSGSLSLLNASVLHVCSSSMFLLNAPVVKNTRQYQHCSDANINS